MLCYLKSFLQIWITKKMITLTGQTQSNDLHNVLRTLMDDPNNEEKTYCVSLVIELESVESIL